MLYKYVRAKIRLSELHVQPVFVPRWELPVLQAVHADVQVVGEENHRAKRAVDAADEFARLANRYGSPEVGAPPFVAAVYGAYGPGLAKLEHEIAIAAVPEPTTPDALFESTDDSLLGDVA
jgi:hypothetical protein